MKDKGYNEIALSPGSSCVRKEERGNEPGDEATNGRTSVPEIVEGSLRGRSLTRYHPTLQTSSTQCSSDLGLQLLFT